VPELPELGLLFQRFGVALGLGLMIGVEREREVRDAFAGIRTFPLIALMGCTAGLLNDHFFSGSFAITFVILAAFVLASYILTGSAGAPGVMTEIASLLVFLFGALSWWQATELAAALAVLTALLLASKKWLENLSLRIGTQDITAALKFGVITLIVLPILPDQTFGPLGVLNPREIWQMVVLIAGINLVGYTLIKVLGSQQGIGLAGVLGGLASSTAATLGFSRHSREEPHLSPDLSLAIVLASTIMFARVLVAVFAINPALAPVLLAPIASAGGVGILGCAILWFYQRTKSKHKEEKEHLETKNPFELWSAIQFGLLFGVVLFIAKAAQELLGAPGVYLSSVVAGGADVDAIVFSLSNLAKGDISERVAAQAITLAAMSNTAVKGLIAITIGAPSMRRYLVPIFGAMITSGLLVAFVII
jgi:uncharacterized membrane protein (DUF4010 family)